MLSVELAQWLFCLVTRRSYGKQFKNQPELCDKASSAIQPAHPQTDLHFKTNLWSELWITLQSESNENFEFTKVI